ncbi:hypothetical protein QC762_104800 [Podospora pseudocomata]|uniref:CFEM domain-containing protein n=1 Tax=Podospora pseudocomata TaxID=2093779 RepID=A0ABR0GT19_9PEZI|nr:hypothetical protein QC762_104800 [Podospora pseudocomata]
MMFAIIAVLLLLLSFSTADNRITIKSFSLFLQQRQCVQLCLWQPVTSSRDVAVAIGCAEPWVNECFCQRELAGKASTFISNCVASRCGSPQEIAPSSGPVASGLSVYNSYCQENGLPIPTVASIWSFDAYSALPQCGRLCFWRANRDTYDLMPQMGCGEPWDNGCLCDRENNEERITRGKAFMTECIASRCGTSQDGILTEALRAWGDYCGSAGLSLVAITEGAAVDSSVTTISIAVGPSQTDIQTGEPETGQISTGAIVGIVVGGVATVAAVVIAAALIMYRKRQNKANMDRYGAVENLSPPQNDNNQVGGPRIMHEKPAEPEVAEVAGARHELSNRDVHQRILELPA